MSRRRVTCWLSLAVLAASLAFAGGAEAGEKPVVRVCLKVDEPSYAVEFTSVKKKTVESRGAEVLARRFAQETAFVHFQGLSADACPPDDGDWALVVSLNRKDPSTATDLNEVGFHFSLVGPDVNPRRKLYWVFRTIDRVHDVSYKPEEFLHQIETSLNEVDLDDLTERLLNQIPVSRKGRLYKDQIFGSIGWELIEHTHEDLCMSDASHLLVESQFGTGRDASVLKVDTTVIKRGGNWRSLTIRGKVTDRSEQDNIARALDHMNRDDVKVIAIYVQKYVLLHRCGNLPPENSGL